MSIQVRQVGESFVADEFEDVEEMVDATRKDGTNIRVLRVFSRTGMLRTPKYFVLVDNLVRHPNCDGEAAIRALGCYLEGS